MLPEKIQSKELSSQQKDFINLLFGKAEGNPKKAGELAGYAPSSYPKVFNIHLDFVIDNQFLNNLCCTLFSNALGH